MPTITTPDWMKELYMPVSSRSSPYIQNLYGERAVARGNTPVGQNLPVQSYAPPTFAPPSQGTTTATMQPPQTMPAEGGLGDVVSMNLESIPDLDKLSQMVNQINQQANLSRVTGGAENEQQAFENRTRLLSGEPPDWWLRQLDREKAEEAYGTGFGADSPHIAASKFPDYFNKSLEMIALGEKYLDSAYQRAAPIWDVSQMLASPELMQKKEEFAAEMGFKYAQLDQDQKQFVDKQAQDWAQYANSFQETVRQFNEKSRIEQEQFAQKLGLDWATLRANIAAAQQGSLDKQAEMAYNLEQAMLTAETARFNTTADYNVATQGQRNEWSRWMSDRKGELPSSSSTTRRPGSIGNLDLGTLDGSLTLG